MNIAKKKIGRQATIHVYGCQIPGASTWFKWCPKNIPPKKLNSVKFVDAPVYDAPGITETYITYKRLRGEK